MAFDLQSIRKGLSALPQFDSIDDDGDVKLYIPASGNLGHELLVWIYIGETSVVADASTRRLQLKGNLKEVAADAAYEFEGFDIKLNSNGDDIRVKRRFDEDNTRQPFETAVVDKVRKFIAAQPEIWAYILDKLGQNAKPAKDFNADDVRQGMRRLPGFQSVDDDGDVKFYIEPTGDLSHEILVWSYVRADHVTVDASTRKLKLKGDLKGAVEAAGSRFSDWTIKLNSDGDDIRVQRRWEASDLNGDNSAVLSRVKESLAAMPQVWAFILDKLGQNAKPAKKFNPDDVRRGFKSKPGFQKVDDDGDIQFFLPPNNYCKHELLMWIYVCPDEVTIETRTRHLRLDGDLNGAIRAVSQAPHGFTLKLNRDGDDILAIKSFKVSQMRSDDVDAEVVREISETVDKLLSMLWGSILEYLGQNSIPKPVAEPDDDDDEEDEEEEITGASFTYTLSPSSTVRKLQEAFTEDYPYLRIGVFMVKTAQGADRSGGTISSYDSDTEFGDIRAFKGECKIRFTPESTPKSLEADFRKVSGLAIKICYNDEDDHRYYISKDNGEYTMGIAKINHLFRQRGYEKADIS